MAVIGYGKIGRVVFLSQDNWGYVGGDNEPPRLLDTLARRHPENTYLILSQCNDDPVKCGLPSNVINTWTPERRTWLKDNLPVKTAGSTWSFDQLPQVTEVVRALMLPIAEQLDGMLLWIGQTGTSNMVLPAVSDRTGNAGFTRPHDAFHIYVGSILIVLNAWRDKDPIHNEEVWLIADNRNVLKARDVKWPCRYPILGQYTTTRNSHHERFGDLNDPVDVGFGDIASWKTDHTWSSRYEYVYSRLEVCGILPEHVHDGCTYSEDWEYRRDFGLFINEAGSNGQNPRREVAKQWILPMNPAFMHGKWSPKSQYALGREITSLPWDDYYPTLRSVRCTLTTPSSCSGWATTKPWEAFLSGTVCFRHPSYDTQDNIYGDFSADVREWLSPTTPEDLKARVEYLARDKAAWLYLIRAQRELYDRAVFEMRHVKMIEDRMKGL